MDRIVTSNFADLKQGVDYDAKVASVPAEVVEAGFFRTVSFALPKPLQVDGRTIYGVRVKGVAFDPKKLDKEFDLLQAYRKYMGDAVPKKAYRVDIYVDERGVVVRSIHKKEPMGAEILPETLGEARGYKMLLAGGEDVDQPLTWYEYDGLETPKGLRVGAMAVGLTSQTRTTIGERLSGLMTEYEPGASGGDKTAVNEWRDQSYSLFSAYIARLARFHGGGRGFYHGSPHPGQFKLTEAGLEHLLVSDIHAAEWMGDMPYPQRIGLLAADMVSPLEVAGRYDQHPLFHNHGLEFMPLTLGYFNNVDDPSTLQLLGQFSQLRGEGTSQLRGLFQLSAERMRPLIDFKDNPLVKALVQQYPE
jgi:hypothetical protein